MIESDKFLNCLEDFPEEYEKFCLVRDDINEKNNVCNYCYFCKTDSH